MSIDVLNTTYLGSTALPSRSWTSEMTTAASTAVPNAAAIRPRAVLDPSGRPSAYIVTLSTAQYATTHGKRNDDVRS
jgi:hypothetical protein